MDTVNLIPVTPSTWDMAHPGETQLCLVVKYTVFSACMVIVYQYVSTIKVMLCD